MPDKPKKLKPIRCGNCKAFALYPTRCILGFPVQSYGQQFRAGVLREVHGPEDGKPCPKPMSKKALQKLIQLELPLGDAK